MSINSLTGQDTINLAGRTFTDFGDGDVINFTYPNEKVGVKTGKNKNSIYAFNETGNQVDAELRVLRGSADDKFLNSLSLTMERDFASFVLIDGEFIKRVGDGLGNVSNDILTVNGGVFTQGVDSKSNVEGETDQAIALYRFKFTNAPRSIT